jgi:hypothetical protein
MAQTNFTPILLYASSTVAAVPSAGNLTNSATGSEIAINIADKNLFFKDSGGVVNTVPIRQSSTSSNGWLSATDWNTFNNKAPATSGTSILYGNGSGGFSNVVIGTGISFAGGTLSATGSGGTVTSVTGTSPVVSSGGTTPAISLATAYGDTLNPYASKTANYVLAAPNGSAGVPTFRALVVADVTGLGTMATQNANAVAITGGTINGTTIGGITPTTGVFTSLTANDNVILGSSNTDTLDVNARITTDLDPNVNNAKDIGTSGRNWRDGFFGRTVYTVNLELTGTTSFDGSQGTAGQVLTSAGTGATPTWTNPTTGTVTSVTGTAPVVSSGGNTPAISMAAATGSVDGYLTSTDWNTFNSKQPAGAYVTSISIASSNGFTGTSSGGATPSLTLATSVTGILKGNGTAISAATSGTDYAPATSGTSILYGNGAGGFSNVTIGTGVSFAGGTLSATGSGGTVTSVAALTLGTTGTDLSSTVANGTTTPVITLNVPTASAANRGALSAADWTTFNNKAPGVTFTTNYIPFGQGTTTLNQSASFTYTTGTSLLSVPNATLTGNLQFGADLGSSAAKFGTNGSFIARRSSDGSLIIDSGQASIVFAGGSTSSFSTLASISVSTGLFSLPFQTQCGNDYTSSSYQIGNQGSYLGRDSSDGSTKLYTGQATIRFGSGGTEWMRIGAGVSIGNTTDPGAGNLSVTGNIISGSSSPYASDTRISITPASGPAAIGLKGVAGAGAYMFFNDTAGTAVQSRIGHVTNINVFEVRVGATGGVYVASGGTSWLAISDEREKDIIEPISDAVNKVSSLRAIIGKYKTDKEGTRRSFLIAQDVQAVLPEAVNEQIDEQKTLGLAYTDVIPLLVAAIKELKQEIDLLKG